MKLATMLRAKAISNDLSIYIYRSYISRIVLTTSKIMSIEVFKLTSNTFSKISIVNLKLKFLKIFVSNSIKLTDYNFFLIVEILFNSIIEWKRSKRFQIFLSKKRFRIETRIRSSDFSHNLFEYESKSSTEYGNNPRNRQFQHFLIE